MPRSALSGSQSSMACPHTLGKPLSFGQVRAKGERKERVLGSLPLSQQRERTALGQHSDSLGERPSILGGTVSAHEMSASLLYLSCHSEKLPETGKA